MKQKKDHQSFTSRQFSQNSDSKKTKSIKSIRIVDRDKQNIHSHSKPTIISTEQKPQTSRNNCLQPHQFSFKKQHHRPQPLNKQTNNQWLLKEKLNSQEQQIKKLQRMLTSMNKKLQHQQSQYDKLKVQYEDHMKETIHNTELKRQICQLKDLMKELLIEKQNDRMMVFYQDQ